MDTSCLYQLSRVELEKGKYMLYFPLTLHQPPTIFSLGTFWARHGFSLSDRLPFCEFFLSPPEPKNVFSIHNILGQSAWRTTASCLFWTCHSWSLMSSFAHLHMHMKSNIPIPSLSLKNTDFSKEGPRPMFRRLWFSKRFRHSTLIKRYWELAANTSKPLLEILHLGSQISIQNFWLS